jgi:hypothetical protein
MKKTKKAAILCICIGCFLLMLGLIAVFTIETPVTLGVIVLSILINSTGIVLLRREGGDGPE